MKHSKICLAQIRPVKGDIATNIKNHVLLIEKSISANADLIVFPELSLTGYEPSICKDIAIELDDSRLDTFQEISNSQQITIVVGVPIRTLQGTTISAIIITPTTRRHSYAKRYLHKDELPFFVKGKLKNNLIGKEPKIALAICYELTNSIHIKHAKQYGADIYLASVAKSKDDMDSSNLTLSSLAANYTIPTLMVNSVGMCEEYMCAGSSAIWNNKGKLLDQLAIDSEGIMIYDVEEDLISHKWEGDKVQ